MRFLFFATSLAPIGGAIGACGLALEGSHIAIADAGPTHDAPPLPHPGDVPDEQRDAAVGDASVDDAPVSVAYAHTPDTLYKIDVESNQLTRVAAFAGDCETGGVIDLAIDATGRAYATTFTAFHKVDLTTAVCTQIRRAGYPNSLAFVRRGDGGAEELVGYAGTTYSRIDPTTGAITSIGKLTGGYVSSGDIVETPDGGAFLTVTGNGCGDCLLRVDPSTGDIVENLGSVKHESVWGLAAWGNRIHGFSAASGFFSIDRVDGGVVTTDLDAGGITLFYGAASALVPASP